MECQNKALKRHINIFSKSFKSNRTRHRGKFPCQMKSFIGSYLCWRNVTRARRSMNIFKEFDRYKSTTRISILKFLNHSNFPRQMFKQFRNFVLLTLRKSPWTTINGGSLGRNDVLLVPWGGFCRLGLVAISGAVSRP